MIIFKKKCLKGYLFSKLLISYYLTAVKFHVIRYYVRSRKTDEMFWSIKIERCIGRFQSIKTDVLLNFLKTTNTIRIG